MIDQQTYLSISQASRLSGYSPEYLRKLTREGVLAGERLGNYWYIHGPSLRAWLLGRRTYGIAGATFDEA